MITEHAVCALPDDHPDWRHLVIRVQRVGSTDQWRLFNQGSYLTADGDWTAMSTTYAVKLTEDAALALARDCAAKMADDWDAR